MTSTVKNNNGDNEGVVVLDSATSVADAQRYAAARGMLLASPSQVLVASPFASITAVAVVPDMNINNKDIYLMPGSPGGDSKDQMVGLTRSFKEKLRTAAGASVMYSRGQKADEWIWEHEVRLVMTLPDGKEVEAIGTYELDLRIPGARYLELVQKYTEEYTVEWINANRKALPRGTVVRFDRTEDEPWGEYVLRAGSYIESALPDVWADFGRRAAAKAQKVITQMRPFGRQRAETGAVSRATCDLLGVQQAYRRSIVQQGFVVLRTRVDMERMMASGLREEAIAMGLAAAAKQLGISMEQFTAALGGRTALSIAPPQLPEPDEEIEANNLEENVVPEEPDMPPPLHEEPLPEEAPPEIIREDVQAQEEDALVQLAQSVKDPFAQLIHSQEVPQQYNWNSPCGNVKATGFKQSALPKLAAAVGIEPDLVQARLEAAIGMTLESWPLKELAQVAACFMDWTGKRWEFNEEKATDLRDYFAF